MPFQWILHIFLKKPLRCPKTALFPSRSRQPFFQLCLACNSTAISYLLDHYSFRELGIANLMKWPTNLVYDPEFDKNPKHEESDLMLAMCLDKYFSWKPCYIGNTPDRCKYEIFQKLLWMGYLNEISIKLQ